MNCMKCGREIEPGQWFCAECLGEMEKYPVKPGVVVQLPPRSKQNPQKKPTARRRSPTPAEQIKVLRKRLNILWAVLILTWALLGAVSYVAAQHFLEEKNELLPGQNYSAVEQAEP